MNYKTFFQEKTNKRLIFNNKIIEIFGYIFLLGLFYYYFFFNDNLILYYRQYDVISKLIQINSNSDFIIINILKNILGYENDIKVYKHYCFLFFFLNLISLLAYLNLFKINFFEKACILMIFGLFPNFYLRMHFGHTTLLPYFQFFISLTLLEIFFSNKEKHQYIYFILANILFSLIIDIQYGIYNFFIIIFYSVYNLGLNDCIDLLRKNIFKFLALSLTIIIFIFIIKFPQINELIKNKRFIFSFEYVNKYSTINPLEFFFNFENIYLHFDSIIGKEIKLTQEKYSEFLKYFTPNGPEFTFYYGLFPLINLLIFYKIEKRFFYYSIISFSFLILLTLNQYYFFSLIKLHHLLFPFIRSIQRIYIILDILFIILFIKSFLFLKKYNYFYKVFYTALLVFFISQKNSYGIKYNNSSFMLDVNFNNKILDDTIFEYEFIKNYLYLKNKQKYLSESKDYDIKFIYENGNLDYKFKEYELFYVGD